MSLWGRGYVTDISYTTGYYREQNPLHLNVACLLGGVTGIEITPETPLTYMELGCGHGFNALVLAASNPHWQVFGVDFAPAHIATARASAEEARLNNVRFLEADLASFAGSPQAASLPVCDVISLHGLWSWVPQPVRDGIVALLGAKLRPGGIAHISYNAMPGWQPGIALQRLLREAGRASTFRRSDRQARAGLEVARALAEAQAQHLSTPFVREMLSRLQSLPDAYLAHEYMNDSWSPCFHGDVVQDMASAKLTYAGSAHILENFPELALSEAQRAVMQRLDDPILRELVKDVCLPRALRHDVFVRGARRLDRAARDAAVEEVMVALTRAPEAFVYEASVPAGEAALSKDFYQPIVAALANRPRRIRELLSLPSLQGERDNPASLLGLLVGTEQALPVMGPPKPSAEAERFNDVALHRHAPMDQPGTGFAIATGGLGSPLPCTALDAHVWAAVRQGDSQPGRIAERLSAGRREEETERLAAFIEGVIAERAPAWKTIIPS